MTLENVEFEIILRAVKIPTIFEWVDIRQQIELELDPFNKLINEYSTVLLFNCFKIKLNIKYFSNEHN